MKTRILLPRPLIFASRFLKLPAARAVLTLFALLLLVVITTQPTFAQGTLTVLHSFNGTDGKAAVGALTQGNDGSLYGATEYGGPPANRDQGTLFKITPGGGFTNLLNFNGANGQFPYAGLVQGLDANFYGTTYGRGAGTVFKIDSNGAYTLLHNFNLTDGNNPYAALIQASDGNYYGTTYTGGTSPGYGTVFKMTAAGALTSILSFNFTNGVEVQAGVIQSTATDFLGTTSYGGSKFDGTVYRVSSTRALTTLHEFNGTDGMDVVAGLVQDNNGNIYGSTEYGGAGNDGTIFEMTPSGGFATLASLSGPDGAFPQTAMILGSDGNLYGTTSRGGVNNSCSIGCGIIFRLLPDGRRNIVYNFCSQANCADGAFPAGLMQATDGNFYGATAWGGANNIGVVYRFSLGLGPFIKTRLTIGRVGDVVRIQGTNLTGTTNVQFNGTNAGFTVVSATEIRTSVPGGASTGRVTVQTPSGTLTSSTNFRVTP
jgi:uncharacterized repeat protein (TIGR03803 family)